ncbi:AAA family ATPase [uncultured Rikenella sp.]|uniref:AAA family ATPase n=1 Tax=uncultured Rikenella sp. TaxID=368003 RepID=UPI00261AD87C|nr:AAA family ATPase [uncultured Rikenella sp.]
MKNKIIEQLKYFNGVSFNEKNHTYKLKDYQFGISVTQLIESYANEFNVEEVASRIAIRDNTTTFEILKKWKIENQEACLKGSKIHVEAQNIWKGINIPLNIKKCHTGLKNAINSGVKQAKQFYQDYKNVYDMLYDEFIVWSKEYDIAGSIDGIMYNKLTQQCCILDFKTNKKLEFISKYKKKMKIPLQKLDDCNGQHYFIQLSIYKFLIEKYTNIKVDELFIVYFDTNIDNYQIIEVPYLKKEVEKILNLRRANKMAKMILVMGEPASGKTVSLRNIPKNELYYIDCDKKGLNYKGWRNDFNEEKKNFCRTNNGEDVKKILEGISNSRDDIKYIAVDTINSIMIADEMVRMKGKNYNEWQDLAKCIFELIDVVPGLRDDLTVIFLGHTQTDDEGFTRLLTNGRKLNKIGLEKYFDTVLIAKNIDGKYQFETTSSTSTARVPMGSFEGQQYVDNDLYEVIKELKEF